MQPTFRPSPMPMTRAVVVGGLLLLALAVSVVLPMRAAAQSTANGGARTVGTETGLQIPRFVTLRAREVNARTGPGVRYPIEWVFQRPNLPVEVVAEFDTWRKIRDHEGTEGWVHQSMLSGRRTVIVIGSVRLLRREPAESGSPVARLEPGVIGWLDTCREGWCEIEVAGIDGWLSSRSLWGVSPDEVSER